MAVTLSIVNRTTTACFGGKLTSAEVTKVAKALRIHVGRDLGPIWGVDAKIEVATRPTKHWQVQLVDASDVDGALGYHWTVNGQGDGQPVAFVGVGTARRYGMNWTITLCHEVDEMLVDPTCERVMPYPGGKSVAQEIDDPVESDRYGYLINGVAMSDFVTPAWYSGVGTRYDFRNVLTKPLSLAPGGYISLFDGKTWTQEFGEAAPAGERSRILVSTRHRRHNPVAAV